MAESVLLNLSGEFNYLPVAQKRKIRKTSSLTPPQPLSLVLKGQDMALLCQNLHLLRKQEEGMEGAGQTSVQWTELTGRAWDFWNKQAPEHFCWHLS